MDVTLSTGNASVDDCIGTLNMTLTTDGYNHADLVGTGTCTSAALEQLHYQSMDSLSKTQERHPLWADCNSCQRANENMVIS